MITIHFEIIVSVPAGTMAGGEGYMNGSSVRLLGRLTAALLVAALAIPLAPVARAAGDVLVLSQATTGGPGVGVEDNALQYDSEGLVHLSPFGSSLRHGQA